MSNRGGFVIQCSGVFEQNPRGRGIHVEKWPWGLDQDGKYEIFANRKLASLALESERPIYNGIANHNVLSHGQLYGNPPKIIHISLDELPQWLKNSGWEIRRAS